MLAFLWEDNIGSIPVGISQKGWEIACSADWYLYLSLYTQPNIEWKHQNLTKIVL